MTLSRIASTLALAAAAGAAAWAMAALALLLTHEAWRAPPRGIDPATAGAPADAAYAAPADWPPLFGTATEGPPVEAPRAVTTDYVLTGLALGSTRSWAVISDSMRNQLVKEGDTLEGGETVVSIGTEGVRIDRDGTLLLVTFPGIDSLTTLEPGGGLLRTGREIQASVALDEFRGRDMRQVLVRAGGVQMVETPEGTPAQRILWVQPGQLYDRIGLQKGDMVMTINDIPAGDAEALSAAMGELLQQRDFVLEIVRAGRVRALRVSVQDNG